MSANQLERKFGLLTCVSIVVGAVIGSSIFMKPATMATQVGSPEILLLVWVVAGIVSLFGGMINAEIGTILPNTGGQFVYFKHMYGDFAAFIYGWSSFIVINTAALAAIAFVFAQYAEVFIQLPRLTPELEQSIQLTIPGIGKLYLLENLGVKSLAIILIVLITTVNYFSLRLGGKVQVISTFLKVGVLLFLIGTIFFSGKGQVQNFFYDSKEISLSLWGTIAGFVAATSGALAAYDGWNNLGFIAGEIKNPAKNIPRGLFIGLVICILLYILTNQAYLYMTPIDEMKQSSLVAADALSKTLGVAGGGLIALMVMISTMGAANGNALPCARVTFAMGEQKLFSSWTGKVHPRYKTPGNALWLQCIWTCMFVISGSFEMLTDMFVFVTWIFYGFGAYGLFVLRKKMPDAHREYKTWGYPVVPIIFILFAAFYFVVTLFTEITNYYSGKTEFINSIYGIVLMLTGVPVYWFYKRKKNK
ncbi:MAG: amino acid permease [Chitinophagaceae bacterium]|nr:MAG: amino acid permease [Chitinophagaceae bacterium]